MRGYSIIWVHAGQATYQSDVPSPATRAELPYRDTHSTDRVSAPSNGLALHGRGWSEFTGACDRRVQCGQVSRCHLSHHHLPGWQRPEHWMRYPNVARMVTRDEESYEAIVVTRMMGKMTPCPSRASRLLLVDIISSSVRPPGDWCPELVRLYPGGPIKMLHFQVIKEGAHSYDMI